MVDHCALTWRCHARASYGMGNHMRARKIVLGRLFVVMAAIVGVAHSAWPACADQTPGGGDGQLLDAVPAGYTLHAYDDCGIPERQPHVLMQDSYCWTFNTSDTQADIKSRSAVFSYKAINVRYDDLDPDLAYLLVLTYASDHVYKRVQSLWANDVQLHGPLELPKAQAIRRIVHVPREVTREGQMHLQIRIHGEVNATASIVELWADRPPKEQALRLFSLSGLFGDLTGQVLDIAYEPVAAAEIRLSCAAADQPLAVTESQVDGWFVFARSLFQSHIQNDLQVRATLADRSAAETVPAAQLTFQPIRYLPLPSHVGGLQEHQRSLDGTWSIDPQPAEDVRARPLDAATWKEFRVPGQWRQQGFEIPAEQVVAVAREFSVPKDWSEYRVFLRFDAIHAGVDYWLNSQQLGHSENLFTPVEWEITSHVRPGEVNRLDLSMKVDTQSERLSYSSGYAFHNLGGIDRSVRIFAVPKVHLQHLGVLPQLDARYEDAELQVQLEIDNPGPTTATRLEISLSLTGPNLHGAESWSRQVALSSLPVGDVSLNFNTPVTAPWKWNAEHPHLYRFALELKQGGQLLERVERNIGFRRIEIQDRALLVNGVPVKLAGACHHETDPLTGRADTMRHAEEDIKLLKEANLNYVRTSHYPPTMELVEAADRYGMYLEVEAPFCWVAPQDDLLPLRDVLAPTSAMVDYYHSHPSVLIWSVANESHFNRFFELSHNLIKQLDPTRPTTFNNPDPRRVCDIVNLHYPPMPYDELAKDDPRPLLLGEYYFPVCHEQTDVHVNPGLREFFAMGQSDPESEWGRHCAESYTKPYLKPCAPPGTWSHIAHSQRVLGGAIWAALDEAFYFPDGSHAGYAWHHGFWGIMDPWRRPKPEWWLTKLVFSPVWFPRREVEFAGGQSLVVLPVENRYSFTNLNELKITWEIGSAKGEVTADVPPLQSGELRIELPPDVKPGEAMLLYVHDAAGTLINAAVIQLGPRPARSVPQPRAGPPRVTQEGSTVLIQGNGFSLVFDTERGDFVATDPRHAAACVHFPRPHLTRYDFGDLAGPHGQPYAVYPDDKTRVVDQVDVITQPEGVQLRVQDHYQLLTGCMSWLIDKDGVGRVTYDYTYRGEPLDTREAGVRFQAGPQYDEVRWHRWSEWGVFPADSISRTEGQAHALRDGRPGEDPSGVRPDWPWSQDQTDRGTADFRSIKFHVFDASLLADDGHGLRVQANADRHVRSCLAESSVLLHVLTRCDLGQVTMQDGDQLSGDCCVELLSPGR